MVPVLTRTQRFLAGQLSSASLLDPHHKMTTVKVMPSGLLFDSFCCSLSHTWGRCLLHASPQYVGYCSTSYSTFNGHHGMHPISITFCFQGRVQQLWLYGHRVFHALLLLGQQRSLQHEWHLSDDHEAP